MTGATCGAGDAHSSGAPDLTFDFDGQFSHGNEFRWRFCAVVIDIVRVYVHSVLDVSRLYVLKKRYVFSWHTFFHIRIQNIQFVLPSRPP